MFAIHPSRLRSVGDFRSLPPDEQGRFPVQPVAQELCRRAAIACDDAPERLLYWQSKDHEIDYVAAQDRYVEVKRGRTGALEFAWFARAFPQARLTVVGADRFAAGNVRGVSPEEFLFGEGA